MILRFVPRGTKCDGPSVIAVRAVMGTAGAFSLDRALDAREGRQREVTYPESEVGPFVDRDSPTYSLDYPFLQMEARGLR